MNKDGTGISFYAEIAIMSTAFLRATISLTASSDSLSVAPHAMHEDVLRTAKQWLHVGADQHFECTEEMDIGDPPDHAIRLLNIGSYHSSPIRLIVSP